MKRLVRNELLNVKGGDTQYINPDGVEVDLDAARQANTKVVVTLE